MSHHHQFSSEMCEPCIETADGFLKVDDPIKFPVFRASGLFFFSGEINIHQMTRKCNFLYL